MPFIIEWVDSCSGAIEAIPIETPFGLLLVYCQQDVITAVDWHIAGQDAYLSQQGKLHEMLAGYWQDINKAEPIKLLKQGSDYRRKVWSEMCQIPFGETMAYSELAQRIGSSARAVGNACRDNPYPLFIPCHRVVSVGGMGGYCGQTDGDFMDIKRKLLAFEAVNR